MPLARLHVPFDHPDWLFELKYDGFRALVYVDNANVQLVSRKGNVYKSFAKLCAAFAQTLSPPVLNGEIVYMGADGRPHFYDLLRRRSVVVQFENCQARRRRTTSAQHHSEAPPKINRSAKVCLGPAVR